MMSTVHFDCSLDTRLVIAGETLANFAAAAVFWLLLRRSSVVSPALRYFLWFSMTINLLTAGGYFLFSGVANIGDWAEFVKGLQAVVGLAYRTHARRWRVLPDLHLDCLARVAPFDRKRTPRPDQAGRPADSDALSRRRRPGMHCRIAESSRDGTRSDLRLGIEFRRNLGTGMDGPDARRRADTTRTAGETCAYRAKPQVDFRFSHTRAHLRVRFGSGSLFSANLTPSRSSNGR